MVPDQLVLVTGAGGFLGAHVVQRLQQDGYRVRGTVRSLSDMAKITAIRKLAPQAKHKIELVEADLCHDDGWDEAASGCWAVLHVACPMVSLAKDFTEKEYQEPALQGTKRVLKAAAKAGVKKFVYTSSLAAVIGAPSPFPEGGIRESQWTDLKLPNLFHTEKSKALAEKAVWDFVKEMPEKERFDLTVLIPTVITGPPLLKRATLTGTMEHIHIIFARTYPGVVNVCVAICDVRDVAEAHCKALTTPKASGERILIHSESLWVPEFAKILSKEFKSQGYSIYTNTMPTVMLWLPSFFDKRIVQSGLLDKIGVPLNVDNSKMKYVFGIKPRPLNDTIFDMAYGMIDMDMTIRGKKYRQAGSRVITAASTS